MAFRSSQRTPQMKVRKRSRASQRRDDVPGSDELHGLVVSNLVGSLRRYERYSLNVRCTSETV
jgi:hypothetical protein